MSHETENRRSETTATVSRRDFLRASSVGGSMACRPSLSEAPVAFPTTSGDAAFPLAEATIATLQDGLDSGEWTVRSILETYLTRID